MSQLTPGESGHHLYEDDELRDLCTSISQMLAALSEVNEAPSGFDLIDDPFSPDEVNFSTNSWLLRIAQVQPWLHLDGTISRTDIEDDAAAAMALLFRSMGHRDLNDFFRVDTDIVVLSTKGAELLNSRLDSAEKFKDIFLESLEENTRRISTNKWNSAWEEDEEQHAEPEPIKAKTDNWRIADFAGKAASGKLNLNPSYQRGDVWPNTDAQKLIESVVRGIPLPSIIILKPYSNDGNVVYEVVDGKQRLTAILRFIGKHPQAILNVEKAHKLHSTAGFKENFTENYRKFKRLWKTHMGEALTASRERELYFPFSLSRTSDGLQGDLECLRGKYYCEIREETIQVGSSKETVSEVFEGTGEYKIPLIEYLDASPRQIHTVFHLYNKQGKHLNAEEIRNAVYHEVDLTRLLFACSGDNTNFNDLVPFIGENQHPQLHSISQFLTDYKFGELRYRRTKLLSWLVSVLLCPSVENGSLVVRSTAGHINHLLDSIRDTKRTHPLRDEDRLRALVDDLHRAIDAHSSFDAWAPKFQDNSNGAKWQELQLVASLAGVFLISLVHENVADVLEEHRDAIHAFTAEHLRPNKSQNKNQLGFIGRVALGLIDAVGASEDDIERKIMSRYEVSCLSTMHEAAPNYKPGE